MFAAGNQKLEAGLTKAREGVGYLDLGQKQYQKGKKGKNQQTANAGLEKMMQGGNMVRDSLNVIRGVKMNNDVLHAKNLESQVEAPTRTILKGSESGMTGIKQFLKGQKLVLENK